MTKKRGTGLLMEWLDIDPALKADFNFRHDEGGLDRFLCIPGILAIGRYEAIEGAPKFLTVYELEDADVPRSPSFLEQRYRAGERAMPARLGRNYLRICYRQIFPTMTDPVDQTHDLAPYLQLGRMDIPATMEEEFNAWYNTAYIPPYLAIDGCLAARRFIAIDGLPRYLTMYELADPKIRHSAPWKLARTSNPWSARFHPLQHGPGSPGIYRRVYPE
jgi:hypothetical protein